MALTSKSTTTFLDHILQLYGDLVFDLCTSLLWNSNNAQISFRSILKEIRRSVSEQRFEQFERAWVLKIACRKLRTHAVKYARKLTPSEQIMLDASMNIEGRLKNFESYFHRLPVDDQILLLLRDKYGLPYHEIAATLVASEGSLKLKRQAALKCLDEWLWDKV